MPSTFHARGDRLEEADHHAAALLAVVAVGGWVLEDRGVGAHPVDRLGDEVVVLGRLVGHDHAVALGELAGPHPGAVDDQLALDVTEGRAHADDLLDQTARTGDHLLDRDSLDDPHPEVPGAAGQAHRDVDGVDPPVAWHVEAREQVVGARQREELGHLARADLVDLEAQVPLEGGHPAVLVEAVGIRRRLDQADPLEPGGHPGLGLQAGVEVTGVQPQPGAGLAGGAEARHQACCVPRRARGEPVALEQEHVADPEVGQVVGDRRADDAAPDDDHPDPLWEGPGGGRGRGRRGGGRRGRPGQQCSPGDPTQSPAGPDYRAFLIVLTVDQALAPMAFSPRTRTWHVA